MVQTLLKSAVLDGEAYAKMVFLTIGKGEAFLDVIWRPEVQERFLLMR